MCLRKLGTPRYYDLKPVEDYQLILDPDRKVALTVPVEIDTRTHFQKDCDSSGITQIPDQYDGRKVLVAVETD